MTPCIIHPNKPGQNGYILINTHRDGKRVHWYAHRRAWEDAHGPIPAGLVVRHRCDTPTCVNPDHLELGTQKQNVEDRDRRGRNRAPKGEAHGMVKLTRAQAQEVLDSPELGYVIAARLGITKSAVSAIRVGKRWKHLRRAVNDKV